MSQTVYTAIDVNHPDFVLGPPMFRDGGSLSVESGDVILPGFGLNAVDFRFEPEHGTREYRSGKQEVVGRRRYRPEFSIDYQWLALPAWNSIQSLLRSPNLLASPYSRWNIGQSRWDPWPALFPVQLTSPLPVTYAWPLPLARTALTFRGKEVYKEGKSGRLLLPSLAMFLLPDIGGFAIESEDAEKVNLAAWGSAEWDDTTREVTFLGTPYTLDIAIPGPEALLDLISRDPVSDEDPPPESHALILETEDAPD